MNSLLLDIVTPTLDSERYLEETILSTRRLRDMGATHLICDSGSSDNTCSIIERHAIASVFHPAGNMYAAINFGFRQLTSEWLTYINSDDILYSEGVIGSLAKWGEDADIIYGNVDYIDSESRFLYGWLSPQSDELRGLFAGGVSALPQPGTLFRRSVWEALQGFAEEYRYSADLDFFRRGYVKRLRYRYYPGPPVAAFRIHDRQFSCVVPDKMGEERKRILAVCQQKVSYWVKLRALISFRLRNIESYLARRLRNRQIRRVDT